MYRRLLQPVVASQYFINSIFIAYYFILHFQKKEEKVEKKANKSKLASIS